MADLMKYLPFYWQGSMEMNAIQNANNVEMDLAAGASRLIFTDSIIMESSEERISRWERALAITPIGSLQDRRMFVLSVLRGVGKLNEGKIKSIVNTFTGGGGAIVTFANSTIDVKVLPPNNGDVFRFPDIERSINQRKPAHLGLVVRRFYSTWGDIKDQFVDWNDVATDKADWRGVYNHISRE